MILNVTIVRQCGYIDDLPFIPFSHGILFINYWYFIHEVRLRYFQLYLHINSGTTQGRVTTARISIRLKYINQDQKGKRIAFAC